MKGGGMMKKERKREGGIERDIYADMIGLEVAYMHYEDFKLCALKYVTHRTQRTPQASPCFLWLLHYLYLFR